MQHFYARRSRRDFLAIAIIVAGCGDDPNAPPVSNEAPAPPDECSTTATWEGSGIEPRSLFSGTGNAALQLPDGSIQALPQQLRCEVLRDSNGQVQGYFASFADKLPSIDFRAAVVVHSGFEGDGNYGADLGSSVELVLYQTAECLPGACTNGTYPASLAVEANGTRGVVEGAGHRLEYQCSAEDDLSLEPSSAADINSPSPGTAYVVRKPGYVLQFTGVECQTDSETKFLSARSQPAPWDDPRAVNRGYGFFASYQEEFSDRADMIPVILSYDYFGAIVSGGPSRGLVTCNGSLAGTIDGERSLEDPDLVSAVFACP